MRAHPPDVRAFARAAGAEAKTDQLDAQGLAQFGAVMPPTAPPTADPARDALRNLVRRRQLVQTRVQERNRLEH